MKANQKNIPSESSQTDNNNIQKQDHESLQNIQDNDELQKYLRQHRQRKIKQQSQLLNDQLEQYDKTTISFKFDFNVPTLPKLIQVYQTCSIINQQFDDTQIQFIQQQCGLTNDIANQFLNRPKDGKNKLGLTNDQLKQQNIKQQLSSTLSDLRATVKFSRFKLSTSDFGLNKKTKEQKHVLFKQDEPLNYNTWKCYNQSQQQNFLTQLTPLIKDQIEQSNQYLMVLYNHSQNKNVKISQKIKINDTKIQTNLKAILRLFKARLPKDQLIQEIFETGFNIIIGVILGKNTQELLIDNIYQLMQKASKIVPNKVMNTVKETGIFGKIKAAIIKVKNYLVQKLQKPTQIICECYEGLMEIEAFKSLFSLLPYSQKIQSVFSIIGELAKVNLNIKTDNIKQLANCVKNIHTQLKVIVGESGTFFHSLQMIQNTTKKVTKAMQDLNIQKLKPSNMKSPEGIIYEFISNFVEQIKQAGKQVLNQKQEFKPIVIINQKVVSNNLSKTAFLFNRSQLLKSNVKMKMLKESSKF